MALSKIGGTKMMRLMHSRKGNVPVTLLVFMSILLASAALFIFVTSEKIGEKMADARVLNQAYLDEEQLTFYISSIMDAALEESKGSDNFLADFKSNFLKELHNYKKEGVYTFSDFAKIESQVETARVENEKIIMEFNFKSSYQDKEENIHIVNTYDKKFEKDILKPYLTAFVLDYSESMSGKGEAELENAVQEILTSGIIQDSKKDVSYAVPFNESVWAKDIFRIEGNNPEDIDKFVADITALSPVGNTNIYLAVFSAFGILDSEYQTGKYQTSIILISDGEYEIEGISNDIEGQISDVIPVYTLLVGGAEKSHIQGYAFAQESRTFNQVDDLLDAIIKEGCKNETLRNI